MAKSGSPRKIWIVFWILFVLTTIEVILGIFKPQLLTQNSIIGVTLLNHIFIILTLFKAYYIVMTFMHLGDEKNQLQFSIVAPMFVLVPYLLFILLVEASFHGAIG